MEREGYFLMGHSVQQFNVAPSTSVQANHSAGFGSYCGGASRIIRGLSYSVKTEILLA